MSQSEPGDVANPNLPSEGNREPHGEQTLNAQPVGLPWAFWLWQCVPMVYLIIAMPPGEDPSWWFHEPALLWISQQPWFGLLFGLIFTTWLSQGVLLAFWLVWGAGRWPIRLGKVIGLAAIATILPAIWFLRHFKIFSPGLNPWSEVLNPIYLSIFFLWAVGVSFLPAFLATGVLYLMRFRVQQVEVPPSSLGKWQFSLKGLSILTLGCSLFLSFFVWLYPAVTTFISNLNAGHSWQISESLGIIAIILSSALTPLLSAAILYWRNWRFTTAIFGSLLVTYFFGLTIVVFLPASITANPVLNLFHLMGTLTLGNLIALTASRYWIGYGRLVVVRIQHPAASMQKV